MTSSNGEQSVTQPGRAARLRLLARRMAAAYYRTLFGDAPETTGAGESGPVASRPGETVVVQEEAGGDTVLVLIRAAGVDGEARWWDGLLAAEALAAGHGASCGSRAFVPLPRASTGPGHFICGSASGPAGTVRVLARAIGGEAESLPPAFDEPLHVVIPTDPPEASRAMWASSNAEVLLDAAGDFYVAVVRADPEAEGGELVVTRRCAAPACGFRFQASVAPGPSPESLRIREVGAGVGFGAARGWCAVLATAEGLLLIDARVDDDATTEMDVLSGS